MNTIIINGKRIVSQGRNISVINGQVIVDGKVVELDEAPVYNIVVEGNVEEISGEFASITVNGDARTVSTISGNAEVGNNVSGNVSSVSGNVNVQGSVAGRASSVSGNVRSL